MANSQPASWIARLLVRELEGFERELTLFADESQLWRTAPGVTNSAGNLALHVCGNLQHFIGQCLGATGYVRDRDAEFSRRDLPRALVIAELRKTAAVVHRTLSAVTDEQLSQPFPEPVGGVTMGTGLFLTHLVSHLGFHLGQAGYLRRMLTGDNRSAAPLPLKPLGG